MPASAKSARSMSAAVAAQLPGQIGSRLGFEAKYSSSGSTAVLGSGFTFAFLLLLLRAASATVGGFESSVKWSGVRLANAPARNPVAVIFWPAAPAWPQRPARIAGRETASQQRLAKA